MDTVIRQAHEQDLEALRKLAAESFENTYLDTIAPHYLAPYIELHFSIERLTEEFADKKNAFFLSCDGDQLTGYLKLRDGETPNCVADKNCLEIERIYADPDQKGRGIGSALIAAAADEANARDRTSIWLGVFQKNTPAVGFYQAKGFAIAGHAIFVMGDEEQDDYVMVKRV